MYNVGVSFAKKSTVKTKRKYKKSLVWILTIGNMRCIDGSCSVDCINCSLVTPVSRQTQSDDN